MDGLKKKGHIGFPRTRGVALPHPLYTNDAGLCFKLPHMYDNFECTHSGYKFIL